MKKEITVFSVGDSNCACIWSNVPYFFTKTLEENGYLVHRVNVADNKWLRGFYNKIIRFFIKNLIHKETTCFYDRSILFALETKLRMKKAVKKYKNSEYYISTSFSFSPINFTDKPCVLFCDWTYEYYISHFLNRKPDIFEKQEIIRQNKILEQADFIFVLFPDVAKYMQNYYRNNNIFYLGNVINTELSNLSESKHLMFSKQASCNILFIGMEKYIEGAKMLILAAQLLLKDFPNLTIDIIGMDISSFHDLPQFVRCHGYLDKNNQSHKAIYDTLISNATVYVNTTPVWAGFSSALEALYYYTPVISTPYNSFLETFGTSINFGYYCEKNEPQEISSYLKNILTLPIKEYSLMCHNAHNATKEFTWDAYITKLLNVLSAN